MGLDNKGIMEVKRAYKSSRVFISSYGFISLSTYVLNPVFLENTSSLLIG